MLDKYVAIIDIGTTKIVCLVGSKDPEGNLHVMGYGEAVSDGIQRGIVVNLVRASEAIKIAVNKAKEQSGIDFQEVYVGIAGQHIFSQQISHSIINDKSDLINAELVKKLSNEVYNMAMQPGEQIIHVFPQSYRVDNMYVEDPVGVMGKQLVGDFSISIGKERSIVVIRKSVEDLGLRVVKIILEPLASAESVLTSEEKEAGTVLVDIGGGTTDMVIFKNNIMRHSAVIPIGGKVVTADICEGCGVLMKQAEELKVQYGCAIADLVKQTDVAAVPSVSDRGQPREFSFKTIAEIIQARVIEVIDTVKKEIDNSACASGLPGGIVLTGGGSLLKHIDKLFEFRTGYETKVCGPGKYVYLEHDAFKSPKYSTSLGLLLKGFCLLYTSPSPRDRTRSRMPSSA